MFYTTYVLSINVIYLVQLSLTDWQPILQGAAVIAVARVADDQLCRVAAWLRLARAWECLCSCMALQYVVVTDLSKCVHGERLCNADTMADPSVPENALRLG